MALAGYSGQLLTDRDKFEAGNVHCGNKTTIFKPRVKALHPGEEYGAAGPRLSISTEGNEEK